MRSSKKPVDSKRQVYLALASSIESQLRQAFLERYDSGSETQSSLAEKLGVNRSCVNRRLKGETNMTVKTLADMVWGLEHCIEVKIYDPKNEKTNAPRIVPNLHEFYSCKELKNGNQQSRKVGDFAETSTRSNVTVKSTSMLASNRSAELA